MLKHIGIPMAIASIAAIVTLAWTMVLSPAQAVAQSAQQATAYITVEIKTGDDSVSWSDPSACSTDYNIYKAVTPGYDGDPITSHTLIGTASSGSTEVTLTITHDTPDKDQWLHDHVEIELYCGTYNPTSTANALLSSTGLNMLNHDELRVGTYSSSPLTALTISSGTLFPEFDRGKVVYTAEVANDVAVITLSPTVLTGYQTNYVKNLAEYTVMVCNHFMRRCSYSYGDGETTGIILADADADTDGFQINLDRGENRLALGVNKGTISPHPGTSYLLTVTVQNSPATGAPTITGSAQIGTTLTADTSDIADIDGLDNVSYSYQWIKNDGTTDTGIHSATGSTYTLVPADEGKTIKVLVSFTDDAGYEETLTSAATALVSTRRNSPATGSPTISGTVQVGHTLTANTSGIADADGLTNVSYSYQWLSSRDTEISGATISTYVVQASDAAKTIKVRVDFTDDAGNEESLTSAATEAVMEPTDRPYGLTATVSENAITLTWQEPDNFYGPDYHILRHRPEEGEPEPLVYVDFTGTDATTFTDTGVEPGVLYVYQVRATIDMFATLGEPSEPIEARVPERETSDTQQASNSPATGVPAISGTTQVEDTLTADTSGIADADGLINVSYSYQWIRNDGAADAVIQDATGASYSLVDADEGKTIKVKVSFTDDAGNDEALTSAATALVAARPNSSATGAPTISGTAQVGETLAASTSGIADSNGVFQRAPILPE